MIINKINYNILTGEEKEKSNEYASADYQIELNPSHLGFAKKNTTY